MGSEVETVGKVEKIGQVGLVAEVAAWLVV